MPEVMIDGKTKHYPYTKAGYRAARKARKVSGKSYTKEQLAKARKMMG